MALRGIGTRRRRRQLNADVNIINLVDVVLVLLIIFMLTAPMLQGGLDVQLPKTVARPLDAQDGLTVTITRDGRIAIDAAPVSYAEFVQSLPSIIKLRDPTGVYIRGDAGASYGDVLRVIGAVQAAGITNVGLVAEPEGRK